MKVSTKRLILIILMALLMLPVIGYTEDDEADPNLPGDPECRICHGTGKVKHGKKAGKIKEILYCSDKDKGKRCKVLIGGWEPCLACEDWPDMQAIFDEHEKIVKKYRGIANGYLGELTRIGAPIPKFASVLSKHFQIFANISHSQRHSLAIASEESYKLFNNDFNVGDEGSEWDNLWKSNNIRYIHVKSKEKYQQLVQWFFNSPYISHGSKSMGLKRLQECARIGFPGGSISYLSGQSFDHDERGVIKSTSSTLLSQAFIKTKNNPFTAWITEGYSAYHQHVLRANVTWYAVAYGMGTRRDREYWGRFSNWPEGLAKANAVPRSKFDESTGSWKGLIPLETLIRMKVTSIPHQGLAQAWALNHYFLGTGSSKSKRKKKKAAYKQFLTLVGSGTDQETALLQVYKVKKLSSLESKFRSWLRRFAR